MNDGDAAQSELGLSRRDALLGLLGLVAGSAALAARAAAGPITRDQFGDQVQTRSRRELPDFARSGGRRLSKSIGSRFSRARISSTSHASAVAGTSVTATTGTATSRARTGTGQ